MTNIRNSIGAILLSIAMIFTMIPMMGGVDEAYAADVKDYITIKTVTMQDEDGNDIDLNKSDTDTAAYTNGLYYKEKFGFAFTFDIDMGQAALLQDGDTAEFPITYDTNSMTLSDTTAQPLYATGSNGQQVQIGTWQVNASQRKVIFTFNDTARNSSTYTNGVCKTDQTFNRSDAHDYPEIRNFGIDNVSVKYLAEGQAFTVLTTRFASKLAGSASNNKLTWTLFLPNSTERYLTDDQTQNWINNTATFYHENDNNNFVPNADEANPLPQTATGYIAPGSSDSVPVQRSVKLIKYDMNDETRLSGATFKLERKNDSSEWVSWSDSQGIDEWTTDSDGMLLIEGLVNGDYRFVESGASSDAYDIDSAIYYSDDKGTEITNESHFTIANDDSEGILIYCSNEKLKYGNLIVKKIVGGSAGDKSKDFNFTLRLWKDDGIKKINYYALNVADYQDYDKTDKSLYTLVGSKEFTGDTYDNIVSDVAKAMDARDPASGLKSLYDLWTENANPALDIDFTQGNSARDAGFVYDNGTPGVIVLTPLDDEINVYFVYEFPSGEGNIIVQSVRPGSPVGLGDIVLFGTGSHITPQIGLMSVGDITSLQDGVGAVTANPAKSIDFGDFTETQLTELASSSGMTFTMKHDQKLTVENIPAGYNYEVTEDDYSSEGYTTTKQSENGTIAKGETATATFTNTKDNQAEAANDTDDGSSDNNKDTQVNKGDSNDTDDNSTTTRKVVSTGDDTALPFYALMMLFAIIALGTMTYKRKRG